MFLKDSLSCILSDTYKEERKTKIEENKGIEKHAAQNYPHGNEWGLI